MTLKQRAVLQTAGILAMILGTSLAVTYGLAVFSAEQIVSGLAVVSIAALVYAMYGVILSRLEYAETLKKIVDSQVK